MSLTKVINTPPYVGHRPCTRILLHLRPTQPCRKVEDSVLEHLIITDSIQWRCPDNCKKTIQLSTGTLFGEAIRRITNEESVSSLFNTGSNAGTEK